MSGGIPKVTVTNEGPMVLSCDGLDKLPKAVQDGLLDMIREAVRVASECQGNVTECLEWESLEAIASDCSRAAGRLYNETNGDTYNPYEYYHPDAEALLFLLLFYSRRRALKAKGE